MKVHKYRLFTELGQGVLEITESTASIRNVSYILSVLPGGALSPAGLDLVFFKYFDFVSGRFSQPQ